MLLKKKTLYSCMLNYPDFFVAVVEKIAKYNFLDISNMTGLSLHTYIYYLHIHMLKRLGNIVTLYSLHFA